MMRYTGTNHAKSEHTTVGIESYNDFSRLETEASAFVGLAPDWLRYL